MLVAHGQYLNIISHQFQYWRNEGCEIFGHIGSQYFASDILLPEYTSLLQWQRRYFALCVYLVFEAFHQ